MSYSRCGNLVEAVTKTFDGKHPCELCKEVARSRSTEPQQPTRNMEVESQATFVAPVLMTMVRMEGASWKLEIPEWHGEIRAEQPTAPPPRGAVA